LITFRSIITGGIVSLLGSLEIDQSSNFVGCSTGDPPIWPFRFCHKTAAREIRPGRSVGHIKPPLSKSTGKLGSHFLSQVSDQVFD
jgi:hypothetical protein